MPPIPLDHLDSLDRLRDVRAVLLDADGNLFPSEEPAFAASVGVTNRFLRAHGVERELTAEELRRTTTGLNFRTTARALLGGPDVEVPDLEDWVQEERRVVTAHLRSTLRPDPEVLGALTALAAVLPLAAVSSSALSRLAGCFTATGLDELVPPASRFSAEDSLPVPTSKPDPAVYLHACAALGIAPEQGLAVEDSVPGALSAVRAGCPTIGNTTFVPAEERAARAGELRAAGVLTVVSSWAELAGLLQPVLGTADRTAAQR